MNYILRSSKHYYYSVCYTFSEFIHLLSNECLIVFPTINLIRISGMLMNDLGKFHKNCLLQINEDFVFLLRNDNHSSLDERTVNIGVITP